MSFERGDNFVFRGAPPHHPRHGISLPGGETLPNGDACLECGGPIPYFRDGKITKQYCSPKCRYKARERARYAANPERERERSRRYYLEHREAILEKAAAKRGRPKRTTCEECGDELAGRQRVACSPKCRDARYRRLHPVEYAANEARKVERRREKRRAQREQVADEGGW